jgi:hypothetical protein
MKNEHVRVFENYDLIPSWAIVGWSRNKPKDQLATYEISDLTGQNLDLDDSLKIIGIIESVAILAMAVLEMYYLIFDIPKVIYGTMIFFLIMLSAVTGIMFLRQLVIMISNQAKLCKQLFLSHICHLAYELGLGDNIRHLILMSDLEIMKRCSETLTQIAWQVIEAEKKYGHISRQADCLRDKFKEVHALFHEFNLANEKWDVYFKEDAIPIIA